MRIGLISDTHGLLRPEVEAWLQGSNSIVHAGDICDASVLERLAAIAPVTAVRGNNDRGTWASALREIEELELAGVRILVVHDIADLPRDLESRGVRVVVSGHSHRPRVHDAGGVLFVNPGSAGRRRFKLPIAAGELRIEAGQVSAQIHEFDV